MHYIISDAICNHATFTLTVHHFNTDDDAVIAANAELMTANRRERTDAPRRHVHSQMRMLTTSERKIRHATRVRPMYCTTVQRVQF